MTDFKQKIDLENVPSGIYFLKLKKGEKVVKSKKLLSNKAHDIFFLKKVGACIFGLIIYFCSVSTVLLTTKNHACLMSELAFELIAKEKKEKTGKLDLGNCGLTELPDELFELTWLEELNLGDYFDYNFEKSEWNVSKNDGMKNRLNEIPEKITKFHLLKKLSLNKTGVEDISVIKNLTELLSLNLGNLAIHETNFLKNLTKLYDFELSLTYIREVS